MVKNKEDIKDYLYSIQNELNIMNNALNEVETISPLITINICNKLSLLLLFSTLNDASFFTLNGAISA